MPKSFSVEMRKVIFSKGPIHLVDCLVNMPSGKVLSRQIIEHPGAVVIIPRKSRQRYLLIRQFRFAARNWLWEFPAGGLEPNESLKKAAQRELMEETGYYPRVLKPLIKFFPTPGISSEMMYLYLADKLVERKAVGDEDEEIEVDDFSLPEIEKMIRKGQIRDAKTILGYLWIKNYVRS